MAPKGRMLRGMQLDLECHQLLVKKATNERMTEGRGIEKVWHSVGCRRAGRKLPTDMSPFFETSLSPEPACNSC